MLSPRKSQSAVSLVGKEIPRRCPSASKSSESLYSNTCSTKSTKSTVNGIYNRRPLEKTYNTRPSKERPLPPKPNEIHQRVVSARRLRMKSFQNQLADAQQHISELAQENRMLRTLHKRQDNALSKYESNNAELPQLLHSHAEEIRCWQTKYKALQASNKELLQKLKQKEAQILSLTDQNKYYSQLNKDKNLDDRQKLYDKVRLLETQLQEKESELTLLARKLELQSTTYKKKLQVEHKKSKDACVKLEKTKMELTGYKKLDEFDLNNKLSKLTVDSSNLSDDLEEKEEIRKSKLEPLGRDQKKLTREITKEENFSKRDAKPKRVIPMMSFPTVVTPSTTRREEDVHQGDGDAPSSTNTVNEAQHDTENETTIDLEKSDYEEDYDEDIEEEDDEIDDQDPNDEEEEEVELSNEEEDYEYIRESARQTKTVLNEIRQQISEEYKGRETFLDNFCTQATSGVVTSNKSASLEITHNIQNNRKNQLLAALKAVDSKKPEE